MQVLSLQKAVRCLKIAGELPGGCGREGRKSQPKCKTFERLIVCHGVEFCHGEEQQQTVKFSVHCTHLPGTVLECNGFAGRQPTFCYILQFDQKKIVPCCIDDSLKPFFFFLFFFKFWSVHEAPTYQVLPTFPICFKCQTS